MAVTITRSVWIDDDGTGTTGTVINQALHTTLYNEIDTALAKVAQLAGGNSFTGNQSLAGVLSVTANSGGHIFTGAMTGDQSLTLRNTQAGATMRSTLLVGNDYAAYTTALITNSTTYVGAGTSFPSSLPNATELQAFGGGGIAIAALAAAPVRFATNAIERMRILPTGEVVVNASTNPALGTFIVAADGAARQAIVTQNSNGANTSLYFVYCLNASAGACGGIAQSGATSVTFNTTSDARLKDDAGRATDLSALRAVAVHDFTWTAEGVRDRGVFAQDAHAFYPRAITPGTDETTADGSLVHPWMTDYSKFVPDLIVGWQQHDAEIAELRAMFAAVKG